LDLTEAGDGKAPISPYRFGDPTIDFVRIDPVPGMGEIGSRRYGNEIAAFVDASNIRGSS